MNTKVTKCSSCGGNHDRVQIIQTAPETFVGTCPTTKQPLEIYLGVAKVPIEPAVVEPIFEIVPPASIEPGVVRTDSAADPDKPRGWGGRGA